MSVWVTLTWASWSLQDPELPPWSPPTRYQEQPVPKGDPKVCRCHQMCPGAGPDVPALLRRACPLPRLMTVLTGDSGLRVLSSDDPGRVSCSPSAGEGCSRRTEPVRAPASKRGLVAEPGRTPLPPMPPGGPSHQRSGSRSALGPGVRLLSALPPNLLSPACLPPPKLPKQRLEQGSYFCFARELLFENCHRHRQVRLHAAHEARRTVSLSRIIALISALHSGDSLAGILASPPDSPSTLVTSEVTVPS